ncbi:anti-sigma regulatory factor (Ser/Thr protein kinase) [Thermocatellispora tengchongensis]|uniref:Anti-sigma regulatory factor (Ser/Thr protein kinase) n=1 Tax=Thermocatellispora tengchongensis TaxID=1073253 RepID=A0A840NTA1_9ACTN|nr:ATP-binding protein [Thermocatellispora tengchongensis]MBB5131934.1 anti-sigma regulatory factor (Ser/Thr protein kinase) [Thermocatellispora tengchongensis]
MPASGPAVDRVFRLSGTIDQIARARRLVSAAVGRDHPLHDDCVLLTSEIATNAVLHSESGQGGEFTVSVSRTDGVVRVRVRDEGSIEPPCSCRANLYATNGRGLPLLEALARRWGVIREEGANTVWFELALDLVAPAAGHAAARVNGSLVNC